MDFQLPSPSKPRTFPQIYKSLRVAALAGDDSACGHYRIINPLTYLNMMGADCRWYHFATPNELRWADVIILQRGYDMVTFKDLLEPMQREGKLVIYEVDDNLHAVDPGSHAYGVFHPGSPECHGSCYNMSNCHGMTVSTMELAGTYQGWNENIRCVPNAIDFEMRDWVSMPEEKDPNYFYFGLAGGLTHVPDWKNFGNVIKTILKKYDFAKFVLYTGKQLSDMLLTEWEIPEDRVHLLPPVSFAEYPSHLGWFDLILAPLKNIRFNSSKSNLRILECGTRKTPGVFSVSAPYSLTIRNGENGFTATSDGDWIEKISYMIDNPEEYRKMGEGAYQTVVQHFDQADIAHEWAKAWSDLAQVARGERRPAQYVSNYGRVGRNDPCPCQSGKKYKNCECAGCWG